jgi:hypothetical protein
LVNILRNHLHSVQKYIMSQFQAGLLFLSTDFCLSGVQIYTGTQLVRLLGLSQVNMKAWFSKHFLQHPFWTPQACMPRGSLVAAPPLDAVMTSWAQQLMHMPTTSWSILTGHIYLLTFKV